MDQSHAPAPAADWLMSIAPLLAQFKAEDAAEEKAEAARRLRIYKALPCTAETFDRALALLDLCAGQVDEELAAEIANLLKGAR